jgi:hypothetical protein
MLNLHEKAILFIAPKFFNYETDIADAMRDQGAKVDFIPDRPFDSVFLKTLTRLRRKWVVKFTTKHYLTLTDRFSRSSYDYVFVVGGEGLSSQYLATVKLKYPTARFIMYNWDSFLNRSNLEDNLPYFDKSLTFDKKDADRLGLIYRPLFFSPRFKPNSNSTLIYDLSFAGTAHSDRYAIVKKFKGLLPAHFNFCYFLYLQAEWVYWIYRMYNPAFHRAKKSEISFSPMSKAQIAEMFDKSKVVLDIESPKQNGLTMRTFETLGSEKKLITSNATVLETDFFDPNNVYYFDRKNIVCPPLEFFTTPYQKLPSSIYNRYSIRGWLEDIFS